MEDHKFKVGDLVRIRNWDDMAKEHNVLGGDFALDFGKLYFLKRMKYLCGQEFVIQEIRMDEECDELNYGYGAPECENEGSYWVIVSGMIEFVDDEVNHEDDAVTQDDLLSVLFGA